MKKIVLFIVLSFIAFSCDKDKVEENTYSGGSFVSFEKISSTSLSVPEDGGAYNLKVTISKEQSSDVNVALNIVVLTEGGVNYEIVSNQVTIPAGQLSGNLTITPVNDDLNTPSTVIKVSISSVNPGIIIGLSEVGSYEKTITLVNDDCPTQYGYWFGSLSIEDVGYGSTPGSGSANINGDCDKLIVDNNLPGIGSATNTIYELIFTPTNPSGSQGTVVVNETPSRTGLSASGVAVTAVYSAFGTYDTSTGEIIIDYSLDAKSDATGAILGTYYTGTNVIRLP
ncbi:hypothetical protein [Flavobacterium sp.]|uniref:hypothetical protein n=1 Tax=Flavobacterium sp. TaxID=239 RepID=UPI0037C142C7